MKTAPVSAVIPCFNCSDTIERAVYSVISQTISVSELILIDDASNDHTLQLLKQFKHNYQQFDIKIIQSKENKGPAAARNIGWNMAKGHYIAFLDSDDTWHPKKIEIQYNWMKDHPDVYLTGHRCQILTDNVKLSSLPLSYNSKRINSLPLLLSNCFLTRSVMIRRHLPFRFNPQKRHSEDYLLWLEIVLSGYKAYSLNVSLGYSYKFAYGISGLTKNLRNMEKGELDTYRRLFQNDYISFAALFFLYVFSVTKYIRRLLITIGFEKKKLASLSVGDIL